MPHIIPFLIAAAVPAVVTAQSPVRFDVHPLAVDANEGIAAADFDGDGAVDLVAGRMWYRGPDWTPRPLRQIDDWNGYVQSNGDYVADVNGDGRPDILSIGFTTPELRWYENPGPDSLARGELWPVHTLADTGAERNEAQMLVDVIGDETPEWVVNSWKADSPLVVWTLNLGTDEPSATPVTIGPKNGHGLGVGDINGDGRTDIAFADGWYEQPGTPDSSWTLHDDWHLHAGIPMIIRDVDGDGHADIIHGAGHDYGLWWERQTADGWRRHEIDTTISQVHTMTMVDLDGDGDDELVTGKRVRAHNGKDPGADDPPCLVYYDVAVDPDAPGGVRFDRRVVDRGRVGVGMQIVARDLDGDGDIDLATAGKSGTHVMIQR